MWCAYIPLPSHPKFVLVFTCVSYISKEQIVAEIGRKFIDRYTIQLYNKEAFPNITLATLLKCAFLCQHIFSTY